MGLDAQLKRYWWAVLAGLVALGAFFQAAGVGRMVAAALAASGESPAARAVTAKPIQRKEKSGLPILARNIFDSTTGPLDGSGPTPAESASAPSPDGNAAPAQDGPLADLSDDAPPCDFGRVMLISASDDPDWTFAAFEDPGGKPLLRRRGDEFSGHTVRAVAYNRVWLEQGGKQCLMKLGDKPKGAAKPAPTGTPRAGKDNALLSPELAAKIHKVSDTEFNVERSVVDEILENQAQLMSQARIVPDKQGDKTVGIKLFGIRPGSLLGILGFRNGDRLESINGFDMGDPQKALEAYGRLRVADALHVRINRGGAGTNIDFNIQ